MASLLSASPAEDTNTTTTTDHSLPSFTTFTTDLDPSWDYYDRSGDRNTIISADVITSQANSNYTRPWEMESKEAAKGFEPFPKLPSFQSQFHAYSDPPLVPEPSLPQPVPVPISPSTLTSPLNGSLTQLTSINSLTPLPPPSTGPSFHTLTTVQATPPPPRAYPLVPAPIQARDIPTIQQQYLDERHIQLYQPITTFAPAQNVVTLVKQNDGLLSGHNGMHPQHHHQQPPHQQLHQPQHAFQPAAQLTPPVTMMETNVNGNGTGLGNFNGSSKGTKESLDSPMRTAENRKKERRKIRASSIESSADSEGSAMELGDMSSGQVSAVSSTANFKSPMGNALGHGEGQDTESSEKGLKQKKRKRCGECIGCQRKDNCGECAPCRNDKSHQICKQRRCEKLTDKKLIYGADGTLIRGESKRGRGKGRGSGTTRTSFRGRKSLKFSGANASPRNQSASAAAASVSPQPETGVSQQSPTNTSTAPPSSTVNQNGTTTNVTTIAGTNGTTLVNGNSSALNGKPNGQIQMQHVVHHQPQQHIQATTTIHAIKDDPQQPMAPMAFYPTWQTADPSQGWQNQFIQQIPQNTTATATIAPLNTIEFQPQAYAYPSNGYVQTFDPNYGRTYAAPTVQRYEFQPGNQVSLQNVSFATTAVTYAGQVATGPSPVLLTGGGGQQTISMAGNEMPGYPRVSSVPPPSLSYNNGYSGEMSGKPNNHNNNNNSSSTPTPDRNSTATPNGSLMNPPPVPQISQSPGRGNIQEAPNNNNNAPQFSPNPQMHHSPHHYGGHQQQQQQQQPSPNPHLNGVTNYAAATPSPSGVEWDWSNGGGNSGDMYNSQPDNRVNLNTRLKTMILNKNDGGGHHNQSPSQGHMSSVELSPPPSNGSAHGQSNGSGGAPGGNGGHFAIIKNVC